MCLTTFGVLFAEYILSKRFILSKSFQGKYVHMKHPLDFCYPDTMKDHHFVTDWLPSPILPEYVNRLKDLKIAVHLSVLTLDAEILLTCGNVATFCFASQQIALSSKNQN